MTTFATLLLALCRRELGPRAALVLPGWLLLGAGAALAHARLSATGQPTDQPVVRLLGDFAATLVTVLAFVGAFQLITRIAEDRLSGWLFGWCGSGGGRGSYVLALYFGAVTTMAVVFATAVLGFASTQVVLGVGTELARLPLRLLAGVLLIAGLAAYGLVLGTIIQRVAPAVLLGVLLFIGPFIATAVIAVAHDLAALPESARFWVLHLPSPWLVSTGKGLLRQCGYVVITVSVSAWLARYVVGRSA